MIQTATLPSWKIEECRQIQEWQRQGIIVVARYSPFPVPCIYDIPGVHCNFWGCKTPWGSIEELSGNYYRFNITTTELPPEIHVEPLRMASAIVDAETQSAVVRTDDGEEILLTDIPAENPASLLDKINRTFLEQRIPIVCHTLQVVGEWTTVTMIHNQHVAVPTTGYAYDSDDGELVYLGAVGHKTALRSIYASLVTNQKNSRDTLFLGNFPVHGGGHWHVLWTPLPGQNHHMVVLAESAVKASAQNGVAHTYLLSWNNEDVRAKMIERLNEALPIPVLDWADVLFQEAEDRYWLHPIKTGGDCKEAYRLTIVVNSWVDLIRMLLKEKRITI